MAARLQFLVSPEDYRANIRRQKTIARLIWLKEQLDEPLEEWERAFLRFQRTQPIPNEPGRRGRPVSGRNLSDVDYAVLRTSRLSESVDYLNPSGDGAPRKHDNAAIAMHVQSMIQFRGMNITRAWADAQRVFKITKEQARYAWEKYGEDAANYFLEVK